jgi:hypothetical protein
VGSEKFTAILEKHAASIFRINSRLSLEESDNDTVRGAVRTGAITESRSNKKQ